ncbi:MAG: hypothetical protein ACXAB4_08885 [Candidatus Hodarchaeales archaeon]|jgi:hypothetical protein
MATCFVCSNPLEDAKTAFICELGFGLCHAKMDDVDFDPKQHSEEQCPVCQGIEAAEVQLCLACFQKEFSS